MNNKGSVATSPQSSRHVLSSPGSSRSLLSTAETTNLADLLERVLDKGIVIAGDITVSLAGIELLTLKLRLLIASVDKAQEIGINWWQSDPFLSSRAREQELASRAKKQELDRERDLLTERLDRLERLLLASPQKASQVRAQELEADQLQASQQARPPTQQRQEAEPNTALGNVVDAALGSVLDTAGTLIPNLRQPVHRAREAKRPQAPEQTWPPVQQPQEAEQPRVQQPVAQSQAPERAQQAPETEQVEQPAGAGPPLDQARPAQIAQAPQQMEEVRPAGQRGEEQHQAEQPQDRAQEAEQPQAQQPKAAPAEQPVGAEHLLGEALHQQIAQALRPVVKELQQWIAQAPQQQMEQVRPEGPRAEEHAQREQAQEEGLRSSAGTNSSRSASGPPPEST